MALLFSYGTLQLEETQVSLFGRPLRGTTDELIGFERTRVPSTDLDAVASTGETHHENVVFNGQPGSRINGTLFDVNEEELAAADVYEGEAGYVRKLETLASGVQAWVYRYAGHDTP